MADSIEASFAEAVILIDQARKRAHQAVGHELVGLYWRLGEYIGRKIKTAEGAKVWWTASPPASLPHFPGRRGYTGRNLFRMRQFYETYVGASNCDTTGDTIAMDPQPHHPCAVKAT